MTNDIEAWRKALKLGDDEDILVSFAWCHDEEKIMMVMFPEYLCTDMTFGLNREQRNLVTFVGCDVQMLDALQTEDCISVGNRSSITIPCWSQGYTEE